MVKRHRRVQTSGREDESGTWATRPGRFPSSAVPGPLHGPADRVPAEEPVARSAVEGFVNAVGVKVHTAEVRV